MSVSPEQFFGIEGSNPKNVSAEVFFGDGPVTIYQPETEEEKLNFLERFNQDLDKRKKMFGTIVEAVQDGEQTTAEGLLQVAGKVGAGAVLDFIGEAIVSAGRGLSAITPDIIENPLREGATSAAHAFLNTEIGQEGLEAAKEGAESWLEFKSDHPRAARNIEAVVDIALLAVPVRGKPKVSTTPIGKAGAAVEKKAAIQIAARRQDFAEDLVMPKQTSSVLTEQVARTEERGIFRSRKVEASPVEKEMADEVIKIEGVSKSKTLLGNHNVIGREVTQESKRLAAALEKQDVIFPRKEFSAQLKQALERLKDNPLIVGDAQKTAERIVHKMEQTVKDKKSTAANLLQARKELDAWVRSQKGPNIFDPAKENALSIAIREIRSTTNDFIASKATNVAVKESLRRQSLLLRAMDNIAPKAADEASNAVFRLWQNVSRLLPLRGEFNQSMALIFGVGGLGAAALFAPFFQKLALAGFGTYATGKFLLGPQAKQTLAALLNNVDRAIVTAKNQQIIGQLRADRALLVELLKTADENLQEKQQ